MRPTGALQSVVAAAIVSMLLAACSGGSGGDKAGGDAAPVTLRMVTMEHRGAPYADGVAEFARQVEDLSAGSMRLDIVWNGAVEYFGAFGPGADQKVAGLVQNWELDLALIPARAWDELGVTSLQALQAPFLVSSEDLVEQVVQSELAGELLAGLDQAGVVGLALLPEGLRHPVGFGHPLLRLADFSGATIRSLPSNVSHRLLEALGAKPVDIWGDAFDAAAANGEIDGAESGFAWFGTMPSRSTFTANITLYPKVNALVANEDAFGRLSDEHQRILREAAAQAVRYVVQNAPTEAERAAVYCRNGGAIAFAAEADVAALERAARPVYEVLQADPLTKELIGQIRAMKAQATSSGDAITPCGPASSGCANHHESRTLGVPRGRLPRRSSAGVPDREGDGRANRARARRHRDADLQGRPLAWPHAKRPQPARLRRSVLGRSRARLAARRPVRREPPGHECPLEAGGRRAHVLRHSSRETARMGQQAL